MSQHITSYLLLTLTILLAACGEDASKTEEVVREYAKPAYAMDVGSSATSNIRLTDITKEAGIDFVHETGAFGEKWMPETMGSGAGFFDYDGDGHLDILFVNGTYWEGHEQEGKMAQLALYRNMADGRFKDVTKEAGLNFSLYGMGCAFADYDGDGDLDIYVTAVGDNKLLQNNAGAFKDVTQQLNVSGNDPNTAGPPAWSTGAAWLDYDGDGWLDLFVCNYVKWTPETDLFTTLDGKNKSYATPQQYQGETCRLYRNVKGQRFEDKTEAAGVNNPESKSLGVAIADFNGDHLPDIVVANDTQPNFLYLNNANGTFSDVALRAGVGFDEAGRARAGMGIDITDISNSGHLSIAIGNFSREPLSLYTQIDPELFQDFAGNARLTRSSLLQLTFGVLFADLDLDGFQDLVVANGHIEPDINNVQQEITFAQRPQLFQNDRSGKFVDISASSGSVFQEPIVGRGLASGDIDNDGDLDLLITTNGSSPKLLRNDTLLEDASWLQVRLEGDVPNRNAIGAQLTVWADGIVQKRMVRTGSSYMSQSDFAILTFGLGSATKIDSLEIRWNPKSQAAHYTDLKSNQRYTFRQAK